MRCSGFDEGDRAQRRRRRMGAPQTLSRADTAAIAAATAVAPNMVNAQFWRMRLYGIDPVTLSRVIL
jgi:hypothetical protein